MFGTRDDLDALGHQAAIGVTIVRDHVDADRCVGIALATLCGESPMTDNHPAIQGSLEYGYEPWGVYLGTWAPASIP